MAVHRRTIGLVSPFVSGIFLGEVVTAVLRLAPEFDCDIVAYRTGDWKKPFNGALSSRLCDGWIVIMGEFGPLAVDAMTEGGRPVCSIAKEFGIPGFSTVRSDNAHGIRLAVDALYGAGHREFAFIGDPQNSDLRERRQAFVDHLVDLSLKVVPTRIFDATDANPSGGRNAALELIRRGIDFTALVAGNDQNAVGALEVLREQGYRVPEDIAVVGYDNSTYAQDPRYQISSVDQGIDRLARGALEEVFRRIDDPTAPARVVRFPPTLVERSSSVPGAAVDQAGTHTSEAADQIVRTLHYGGEVSRYLSSEASVSQLGALLNQLTLQDRHTQFVTVRDQRILVEPPGVPEPLETFGKALWDRYSRQDTYLFILPIFYDSVLTHALALVIPKAQIGDLPQLTLFAHELELLSVSVERSVAVERLEALVAKRTAELDEVQRRLIQSAKLDVMTPIVTGIAHHLNTPLGNCLMVVSDLDLQVAALRPDPTLDLSLGFLRRNLDQTIRLVEQFRHVAHIQVTDEAVEFSLGRVVGDAVVMAHAQHARPDIETSLPEEGFSLVGSPNALREAVKALLENALVHGCRDRVRPRVWITLDRRGDQVALTVGDNGPGVAPALAERIFEPFFTTRLADSSGLGLTLAYNVVVTLFGGTIRARTVPGEGFQVECLLPLAP